MWRQLQTGGAYGGPNLQFSSAQTHGAAKDTAGVLMDVMQTQNTWVSRVAPLDAYAGQALTGVGAILDPSTPASTYAIYYGDMAIVKSDGTVLPILGRQTSGTFTNTWNTGGQPNQVASSESAPGYGPLPQYSTTYFHGDHLGSARMLTAAGGWPVSSTTFYPFGVEEPGAGDTNHFRYASLERDAESGLDSATFRQLSSAQGRWLTPDPYDGSYDLSNPQSLNRYAYVLNNPMRWTDPLGLNLDDGCPYDACVDGGSGGDWFVSECGTYCDSEPYIPADPEPGAPQGPQAPVAPSNLPPPCVQSFANAMALDYSQPIHNGQTTQQHIESRHMPGVGKQNVSTYWTQDFSVVTRLNFWTFLLGNQTVDSRGMTFQFTFPNLRALLTPGSGLQNGIGYDKKGNDTLTNNLGVEPNCKIAVTSYPIHQ